MFNFFKKKKSFSIEIHDEVWMSEKAKYEFMRRQLQKDNDTTYIFWFDETRRMAESFMATNITSTLSFISAREIIMNTTLGKKIIFAEHYPMRQQEKDLFEKLHLHKAEIWSSLDEPLFKYFGGDKIISLMKKMGLKETEAVHHNMLSKAIQDAQEKIQKKIAGEQTASSQKEWLERNLIA